MIFVDSHGIGYGFGPLWPIIIIYRLSSINQMSGALNEWKSASILILHCIFGDNFNNPFNSI